MIEGLYQRYLDTPEISTDTRSIAAGSIFFALKGPNFDANKFAAQALEKGASYVVVDDPEVVKNDRYLLVDDVLLTLQALARHHRAQLTIPVIGLTGSNGKTTTKELINVVLATQYSTYATEGNLNNHIGVPLSVLSIGESHDIAIIEMGANHVGEIALLSSICKPSHGLITNIGKAHLEGFGGIQGVIRGKSELYQHLINVDGTVWINSNSRELSNMAKRFKNPLMYANPGDYYHCELLAAEPFLKIKTEEGHTIDSNLTGKYNFDNVAVALAIGKFFAVDPSLSAAALSHYESTNMRSELIQKGSNHIILDAYNANPDSMKVAVENLAFQKKDKKVVILGDMKELGEESDLEHRKLGEQLADIELDQILLCGELIKPAKEVLDNALYFTSRNELQAHLRQNPIQHSLILIKASRSIGLEKVLNVL
ncbi:MAG: UDP-N-acetylmuramoyl-tripeptide--D-alanyl-D-alanine ligase [Bacteroidota bacterium]